MDYGILGSYRLYHFSSSYMIETAQWWNNHFNAGLTFEGREGGEWLWSGKDENFKWLGWLEDGLTLAELEASK